MPVLARTDHVVPSRELPPHEYIPSQPSPTLVPGNASIAWRGDSLWFATVTRTMTGRFCHVRHLAACPDKILSSPEHVAGPESVVRIWDREGCQLHSVGEYMPGLLPVASWQPNGRHLYVARSSRAGAELQVVLFERNGLQHGSFDVPGPGKLTQQHFNR